MRVLALSLATASVIAAPVMVSAQSTQRACVQAQADAEHDVNGLLWMAAGFFFGLLGVGAAYVIEPTPPAMKLMGKSSEYVAVYTDCYKRAGRDIQVKKAITGCVVAGLLEVSAYACCCLLNVGALGAAAQ